jgi:hypothetical protein
LAPHPAPGGAESGAPGDAGDSLNGAHGFAGLYSQPVILSPPFRMSLDHSDHARGLVDHVMPHEPLLRAWLQGRFGAQLEIDAIVQDA